MKYLEVLIVPSSDEYSVNIEKNPLRTTNWTVSWIIQTKGYLFCPTNWYLNAHEPIPERGRFFALS